MSRRIVYLKYGKTPYIYLLDSYPSGVLYAFSMRRLNSYYLGPCLRVRRTDNTELDIGFVDNYVDVATMEAFVGAGDGRVTTWYDQSGNGNDKIQTTASFQPYVRNTGVTYLQDGFLAMSNGGAQVGLTNAFSTANTSGQAFHTWSIEGETLPANVSGSIFYGVMQSANAASPSGGAIGTITYAKNKVDLTSPTRDDLYDAYFNLGLNIMTARGVNLSAHSSISSKYPGFRGITGNNLEEIVYSTQTEPRSDIEDNIIAYYGI